MAGHFLDEAAYDTLLVPADGDVLVLKPDGTPLLCVCRQVLKGAAYRAAYMAIRPLALQAPQDNRGVAAGLLKDRERVADLPSVARSRAVGKRSAVRYSSLKRDGTVSTTSRGRVTPSFVAGYSDRSPRFPYCRQTAYTARYPERLQALVPCLRVISQLLQTHVPARYVAQAAVVARTVPEFIITGTVFTTLTVNRNWQTAVHRDVGDLKTGFGAMACFRAGDYAGGYYVMPQFRVAVDLYAGDVVLSDVHEWHGNTPLHGNPKAYERITMVCYYRERMVDCLPFAEELERVRRTRGAIQ